MKYTHFFGALLLMAFFFKTSFAQDRIYSDTTTRNFSHKGLVSIISVKSFPQAPNTIPTQFLFSSGYQSFSFPEDFEGGYDSTFAQTRVKPNLHLTHVWTFADKYGNATYKEFYPSGKLKLISNFKGQGLQKYIQENTQIRFGTLSKKQLVRDTIQAYKGVLDGKILGYHENGALASVLPFSLGQLSDTMKVFYPDGKLARTVFCESGSLFPKMEFSISSSPPIKSPVSEETMEQDCYTAMWYPSGQKQSETYFGGQEKPSSVFHWYENGNPKIRMNFLGFDTLGVYEEYHQNGQPKKKGYYDTIPHFETVEGFIAFMDKKSEKVGKPLLEKSPQGGWEFLYPWDGKTFRQGEFSYWDETGSNVYSSEYELGILVRKSGEPTREEMEVMNRVPHDLNCFKIISFRLPKESRRFNRDLCIGTLEGFRTDTFEIQAYMPEGDSLETFTEIIQFENPYGKSTYESFYPNGNLQMRLHFDEHTGLKKPATDGYKEGVVMHNLVPAIGTSTYWYPDGSKKWERTYFKFPLTDISQVIEEKTFHPNGKLKSEESFGKQMNYGEKGFLEGLAKEYFENGQIKWSCTYTFGKKEGSEKFWNVQGKLRKHLNYRGNKLHKWQYFYNDAGKLIRKEYYVLGNLEKKKDY